MYGPSCFIPNKAGTDVFSLINEHFYHKNHIYYTKKKIIKRSETSNFNKIEPQIIQKDV